MLGPHLGDTCTGQVIRNLGLEPCQFELGASDRVIAWGDIDDYGLPPL